MIETANATETAAAYPKPTPHRTLYVAEPPAFYLSQPPLIVDCSIVVALLFQESTREEAERRLADRTLHAPELLDYEIANVALKKIRNGQPQIVAPALAHYEIYPVALHGIDVQATVALAERYRLSGYDAAYLWLASELKAPLATFDAKLAEAARLHLGSLR